MSLHGINPSGRSALLPDNTKVRIMRKTFKKWGVAQLLIILKFNGAAVRFRAWFCGLEKFIVNLHREPQALAAQT